MKINCCRHYNGLGLVDGKVCDAGVSYTAVARPISPDEIAWQERYYPASPLDSSTAIMKRVPCFAENGVHTCLKFDLPTQKEVDEYNAMIDRTVLTMLRHINIVRPLIVAQVKERKAQRKTIHGTIPCPICGAGTVNWSYAGSVNGHIHAQCSTPDCVQWIE